MSQIQLTRLVDGASPDSTKNSPLKQYFKGNTARPSINTISVPPQEKRGKKEELEINIHKNEEMLSALQAKKAMRSEQFYKDARVVSCSSVLIKNGHTMAIPFEKKDH
jgi:hypothetical protein